MSDREVKIGGQKRCMGLWLMILGGLFAVAMLAGKGTTVNSAIIAYGFVIAFFFIFLNKKLRKRLEQGELTKVQHAIVDYSVAFTFLLIFFLVSPFFKMLPENGGWVLTLFLMGIHYLILSKVHGKSMLILGSLVILDAALLFFWKGVPLLGYLGAYVALATGFGMYLFFVNRKESEKAYGTAEM